MPKSPSLLSHAPANIGMILGSQNLSQVQHLPTPGVILTPSLSRSRNFLKIRTKISSKMAAICRFSFTKNMLTCMSANNAFARLHLNYCQTVLVNTNATVTNKMNHTLPRCMRIIFCPS